MSTTIPDLWSDDIQVNVLTPLVILRAQESLLGRKTQGILEAKVSTTTTEEWEEHHLDLIAPALNRYQVTLLKATHASHNMVYPVIVTAECFLPKPRNPFSQITSAVAQLHGELTPDQREAANQDEFIALVRQVLRSVEIRGMIQSLIARSNEATHRNAPTDEPTPVATSEASEAKG